MSYQHLAFCEYDEDWRREYTETPGESHTYSVRWKALALEDDLHGAVVLYEARLAAAMSATRFDPIPRINDHFNHLDVGDYRSFCNKITCELVDEENNRVLWIITAEYGPPEQEPPQFVGTEPLHTDPLLWDPQVWIEVLEDQAVVEKAWCLTDLPHLQRGPNHELNEPGPIVNAAAQQTVDPQLDVKRRILIKAKVNYPNFLYAMLLNEQFGDTVHAPPEFIENPYQWKDYEDEGVADDRMRKFLGFLQHGTVKFIMAEAGDKNWAFKTHSTFMEYITIEYCPVIITLEYNRGTYLYGPGGADESDGYTDPWDSGWIRQVLNNGQTCYRRVLDVGELEEIWLYDPRFPKDTIYPGSIPKHPLLMPTVALQFKDPSLWEYSVPEGMEYGPRRQPNMEDMIEVETSEPMNLKKDGTQIMTPSEPANYIWYLNLRPANYYHMNTFPRVTPWVNAPKGQPVWPTYTLPADATFPLTIPPSP